MRRERGAAALSDMKGAPLISLISPRPLSGGPNASQPHSSLAAQHSSCLVTKWVYIIYQTDRITKVREKRVISNFLVETKKKGLSYVANFVPASCRHHSLVLHLVKAILTLQCMQQKLMQTLDNINTKGVTYFCNQLSRHNTWYKIMVLHWIETHNFWISCFFHFTSLVFHRRTKTHRSSCAT